MKEKKQKATNHTIKNKPKDFLIPIITSFVFIALIFTPVYINFNSLFYDLFLTTKNKIKEDPRIVLLNVDDKAIDKLGAWPWPRSYMADALIVLKELRGRTLIFDIEYNTPSPAGINNLHLKNDIPNEFHNRFRDMSSQFTDFFFALKTEQISLEDAEYYINDLIDYTFDTKDDLLASVDSLVINNDDYLAQAIGFFGNVSSAYRVFETENTGLSDEDRNLLKKKLALEVIKKHKPREDFVDFQPSLVPMMMNADKSGFVNVIIDPDGKRRRLNPLAFIEGEAYSQLVFSTVLEWLDYPTVEVEKNKIRLINAKYDDKRVNISIPLDSDYNMLINWPHKVYDESFIHVSIYDLVQYKRGIDELAALFKNLELRDSWQLFSMNPLNSITDEFEYVQYVLAQALQAQTQDTSNEYVEAIEAWYESIAFFFDQGYEEIVSNTLEDIIDASEDVQQAVLLEAEKDGFALEFENTRDSFNILMTNKKLLTEQLEGTMSIIGYSGTGTTDIGATPFDKAYINIGTHASFANTIFQRDFLQESSRLVDIIGTLLIPILFYFLARRLTSTKLGIAGIIASFLCVLIPWAVFKYTGYFYKLVPTLLALLLSYLIYSLIRYFRESREKSFLQKAIGTYVSNEVLNEIIEDPSKLKLGGESRHMTVIFTDVKGFSSISEKLTPEELVTLLNAYLTGMSDIILDEKGVVDKYEGDAIIAFWGAPNILENHAYHSIAAAVKMKILGEELNKKFIAEKMTPAPLLTRFGINTGEMVAGNMGTERKMNYTVMGNAVNLAARLEGVNKMYGTWILTTDYTAKEAGDEFIYRRLDQVRVVGINTPVQLLEVIDFKNSINSEKESFLKDFEKALDLFNERNYKAAQDIFDNLLKINAEDGPSTIYRDRCIDFIKSPPAKDWDGVFNLTQK